MIQATIDVFLQVQAKWRSDSYIGESMKVFKTLFFVMAAILTASPAGAAFPDNRVVGKIVSYGLYATTGKAMELPAPNAAVGKALLNAGYTHRETTDTIPMSLGNNFGFKFHISNIPTDVISRFSFICRHPPIKGTGGKPVQESSYEVEGISPVSYIEDFFTYELSTPAELVPGSWTLEIWRNGKKLVSKTFMVK